MPSASSPSVSKPFCGACDRVRLTADGQLRNCLFARTESDLRAPLRAGATDEELADQWVRAVATQASGPRHRRPVVPAARPADVGHRRLTASPTRSGRSSTSRRKPRVDRNEDSDSRCSAHASQCLRRSGVWIFGLFHRRSYAAGARQSLRRADQTVGTGRQRVDAPRAAGAGQATRSSRLLVVIDLAADDLAALLAGGDGGCVARVRRRPRPRRPAGAGGPGWRRSPRCTGRNTAPANRTQRKTPGTKIMAMKQAVRNAIVIAYRRWRVACSWLAAERASVITVNGAERHPAARPRSGRATVLPVRTCPVLRAARHRFSLRRDSAQPGGPDRPTVAVPARVSIGWPRD